MSIITRTQSLGIKSKLFLPIGGVIVIIVATVTMLLVVRQNQDAEKAFRENLESIAVSSRMMVHSAAEEYAKSKGIEFHRNPVWESSENSDQSDPGWKAMRLFMDNPGLSIADEEREVGGVPHLFVHVPARIQNECMMCHGKDGLDIFGDRKMGDLVAVFGVSGSMQELRSREKSTLLGALGVGIVVIGLISIVVRYQTTRQVLDPLCEVVAQLDRVAGGDLNVFATPALERKMSSGDEVGRLARSFKKTLDELRGIILSVGRSSEAVASASSQISSTSEEMATAAEEQSGQTSEVAGAVEEMAKTIVENSRSAQTTSETAAKAEEVAEQGGRVVEETVAGMKRIADVVTRSAETVRALGRSSEKIGEIIGVIDDIADQTNLLALNAAIEAARAGEQGRGFAVVADEVRKLAERTVKATKEIAGMIKAIQTDTSHAVGSMEEGTRHVDEGIKLADRAGASLKEIVTIIQHLSGMVEQIASASNQQSSASEQIAKNVEAISSVTNQSAAGVQQIARAAEDLNQLTEQLQMLVSKFKISEAAAVAEEIPASGSRIQPVGSGSSGSPVSVRNAAAPLRKGLGSPGERRSLRPFTRSSAMAQECID
jgi:methyl-accepting chemotaxis protein